MNKMSSRSLLVAGVLLVAVAGAHCNYVPQSLLFSKLHNLFLQRSGLRFGLPRLEFPNGLRGEGGAIAQRGIAPRRFTIQEGREAEPRREQEREIEGEGVNRAIEPRIVRPSPSLPIREAQEEPAVRGEAIERMEGMRECDASPKGYNCMMQLAPFFKIHWTVGGGEISGEGPLNGELPAPREGEISFAMEGMTDGWVGMGFPEELRVMVPAGIVLGWIEDSGEVNVRPFSVTERAIVDDDENRGVTLTNTAGSQEDGYTLVAYTIPIQSELTERRLTDFTGINFATGTDDALVFHGGVTRGGEMIDLNQGL